jgi:transposase
MRHISEDKRNNIRALILDGLSLHEIAERCQVSHSTVSRIREKYYPDLPHPPGGRPRKLSDQDRHWLVRQVTSDPSESSEEATRRLESEVGVHVSSQTVRRALHEAGISTNRKGEKE